MFEQSLKSRQQVCWSVANILLLLILKYLYNCQDFTMELKDIFQAVLLKRWSIVFLACFIALSSAAPVQQEDEAVLSWLKHWNRQLEQSAANALKKYNNVRFAERRNSMPFLSLGILKENVVTTAVRSPQNILDAICRQLMEFKTAAYLAFYDESQHVNSEADLTKSLLNLSAVLNSTTETARYLFVRKFPDASQPQAVKNWSREVMYTKVALYKFHPQIDDPNSVNELRSWATLSELIDLPAKLKTLFTNI